MIAHAQEIRGRGEQLANEQGADQFKLLGAGPSLLDSKIIIFDYVGQPHTFMTFYQYMGYVLTNRALEKVASRLWDIGGETGNGFEIIVKLPARPTLGLLFQQDESDVFLTHIVTNGEATQLTRSDLVAIHEIMERTAGLKEGELQLFLLH